MPPREGGRGVGSGNSRLSTTPPDPFEWNTDEAVYTLYNFHGEQHESYASFSVSALQCSHDLLVEMSKKGHTPDTPYPGGKFSCGVCIQKLPLFSFSS